MDRLFEGLINSINQNINLRMIKHNLLSSNIANSDLPNYKGFDLMVEDTMKSTMDQTETSIKRTHPLHLKPEAISGLKITDAPYIKVPGTDVHELDLNRMMSELAENSIKYQAAVEFLNRKLGSLKYAIEGR